MLGRVGVEDGAATGQRQRPQRRQVGAPVQRQRFGLAMEQRRPDQAAFLEGAGAPLPVRAFAADAQFEHVRQFADWAEVAQPAPLGPGQLEAGQRLAPVGDGVGVKMRRSRGAAGPEALGAQVESYTTMLADERAQIGR